MYIYGEDGEEQHQPYERHCGSFGFSLLDFLLWN